MSSNLCFGCNSFLETFTTCPNTLKTSETFQNFQCFVSKNFSKTVKHFQTTFEHFFKNSRIIFPHTFSRTFKTSENFPKLSKLSKTSQNFQNFEIFASCKNNFSFVVNKKPHKQLNILQTSSSCIFCTARATPPALCHFSARTSVESLALV